MKAQYKSSLQLKAKKNWNSQEGFWVNSSSLWSRKSKYLNPTCSKSVRVLYKSYSCFYNVFKIWEMFSNSIWITACLESSEFWIFV